MKRIIWSLLALALLALPAVAEEIPYFTIWSIPSGRVDANCETINETERHNRNANLVRRTPYWRAPIEVTTSGNFNPNSGNVLLQCGWTYKEAFSVAEEHGYSVLLNFTIHTPGQPNGQGYHAGRAPIMGPSTVDRFVAQFMQWLSLNHPALEIYGWQLGNEVEYDRTGTYTHDKYFTVWQKIKPRFPSSWIRVNGGNSGLERKDGKLTHNGWWASTGRACQFNVVLDIHGNGESDGDFRDELEELRRKYPCVKAGSYEDRAPSNSSGRYKDRAQACRRGGAVACASLIIRDSGYPPNNRCEWGTHGPRPDRWHIGVEGCNRRWNDGTESSPRNWQKLTDAARYLGTYRAGTDLPNRVEGGGGNPDPPAVCKGMHQWCSWDVVFHRQVLGVTSPNPVVCKENERLQAIYETWLRAKGFPCD